MGKTLQESQEEFNKEWARFKSNLKDRYVKILLFVVAVDIIALVLWLLIG